jgi:hypothetical protein
VAVVEGNTEIFKVRAPGLGVKLKLYSQYSVPQYKQYVPTHRPLPHPVAPFCLAWQTSSSCTTHLDPLRVVLWSTAGRVDLYRHQRDPCPSWQEPQHPPIFNRIISPSVLILLCAEDVRKSFCYQDVLMQATSSLPANQSNNFLLDEVSL